MQLEQESQSDVTQPITGSKQMSKVPEIIVEPSAFNDAALENEKRDIIGIGTRMGTQRVKRRLRAYVKLESLFDGHEAPVQQIQQQQQQPVIPAIEIGDVELLEISPGSSPRKFRKDGVLIERRPTKVHQDSPVASRSPARHVGFAADVKPTEYRSILEPAEGYAAMLNGMLFKLVGIHFQPMNLMRCSLHLHGKIESSDDTCVFHVLHFHYVVYILLNIQSVLKM